MIQKIAAPRSAVAPTRRRATVIGLVLLALVLVTAGVLRWGGNSAHISLDQWWLDVMLDTRQAPFVDVARALNDIGGGLWGAVLIPAALVILVLLLRGIRAAGYLATSMIAATVLAQILKHIVARPRPEHMLVASDFGSFPSGHSVQAAVLAIALGLIFARAWVWWVGSLYAVAMLWSRTYLGVHWLTDVLAGAALGVAVALLSYAVWEPWMKDDRPLAERWRRIRSQA